MSALPGNLETDQQPPMTVPLRHFVLGLGFLMAGIAIGLGLLDTIPGNARLAHVHLLLVGWVCLTIMGAMTQFVPVWSGTNLHSRRLANIQLALVAGGLVGFATAFVLSAFTWLAAFGMVMLAGFWVFVYNVSRTLATLDSYDVTSRHFLFALACFLLLTVLGFVLALDFSTAILASTPVTHGTLVGVHATLAVFGAVLTTIYGALYQLGTMFTQTELHGVDHHLQTVEEVGHPTGVVLLAGGRLVDSSPAASVGGLLVLASGVAFALVLGRKLSEMQVEWTPMHSRYAVVVPALLTWAVVSLPAWVDGPTGRESLFGASHSVHLLLLGIVGFVVFGTLYHVIPFIIWIHQYSDRLGLEDVPMIDDLYSDRLAAVDFTLLVSGTVLLVVSDMVVSGARLSGVGGLLMTAGVVVFTTNLLLVVHDHSPHSLTQVVLGSLHPWHSPERENRQPADSP